jgi:hypothetical protein
MSVLFRGLGDTFVRTKELSGGDTAQHLIPYPVFDFEFAQDAPTEDALAYVTGVRQPVETLETTVTSTLKLSTQLSNWKLLGLALNEVQRALTSFTIPKKKSVTVPATPFEVTDSDITTGTAASVLASITDFGAWGQTGPLTPVAIAPSAGEVQVDGTNGKLIFHSSAEGAPVDYIVNQAVATANAYGGPGSLTRIGKLEFQGTILDTATASDGGNIWIPILQRRSRPTLSFTGGVPTLEINYTCLTPDGWEEPYRIVDNNSIA